jgi:hypothetical protein
MFRMCVFHPCKALAASVLTGLFVSSVVCASAFGQPAAAKPAAVLTVQVDNPLHSVSPTLYGMMTEEINYSYDGGFYAEIGAQPDAAGSGTGISRIGWWCRTPPPARRSRKTRPPARPKR